MSSIDHSKRSFLARSAALSGVLFLGGISPLALAKNSDKKAFKISKLLSFQSIPHSTRDAVTIAEGYSAEVLISWGDGLFADSAKFHSDGSNTAADQQRQFGDSNDGMSLFEINNDRLLLVVNHESPNAQYLHKHGGELVTSGEDTLKSQASVGISVVELQRSQQGWRVNTASKYNRRLTANTPMSISGPAKGHAQLVTKEDASGSVVKGTFANCSNGQTPWGTYLTCEENFDDMFGYSSQAGDKITDEMALYGVAEKSQYGWEKFDSRFDLAKNPNEFNRFGWVVEIDPFDPTSTPIKRTALGRFKHENAAVQLAKNGKMVVYMGDDERGEFIYKFVSDERYKEGDDRHNRQLLDHGTLYVAVFDGGKKPHTGSGKWLPLVFGQNGLTPKNGFHSQADICIHTRKAARIVGGTDMDRPEWVAVNPKTGQVFCTLTNNNKRGSDKLPVNAANPREKNLYGQIIRWREQGDDHTALSFSWDMFLIAGNPNLYPPSDPRHGSSNITKALSFNSPDGLAFDRDGRIWFETDGKYSNTGDYLGQGNNQMFVGDPETGEIRRFMTGPKSCELTGICWTPDDKTMLVNVQHPGEAGDSTFPNNSPRPRSSVMMIRKNDGGTIGS
ncbi:hypothetical protein EDC56_2499 [Sinobacterium caligoides]|uniref:PhoX family phosphatase n=1 Tax=Sinobacterium caligoides TaxID=933926 RepID=A0A3N2DR25_9GAMM|nr:PhoX family phosphatase [Sinobacterium caligoides]ROS02049.1 hypothetical protein EDC56_2499 [Sinobacterium caligoides]